MKSIAITGATGFVGSHMVKYFASQAYRVIALGRQKQAPIRLLEFAQWQQFDLSNNIPVIDTDILIHCAGLVDDHSSYHNLEQVNVIGTKKLLQNFRGKHFIYISSASVYSSYESSISETSQIDTRELSKYGLSKLKAENEVKNWTQCKTTIIRPRAVYGTRDRVLLPRILNLKRGRNILFPVRKNAHISMTHIDNLCHAVHCAIQHQTFDSRIYNVADTESYYMHDVVADLIKHVHKQNIRFRIIPRFLLLPIIYILQIIGSSTVSKQAIEYLQYDCVLDIQRAINEIQYRPTRNFYDSLDSIGTWVDQVGIENIAYKSKNICWEAC